MTYKEKELLEIIECSKAMLKQAELGDWEKVFSLEAKRAKQLAELFSLPLTKQEKIDYNSKIQAILVINKKLEATTAGARDLLRKDADTINKGRHAIDMYAQNTG